MDGVLAQERVRKHWDRQPCDSELSTREPTSRDFYLDIERQRYALQPHILECQDWIDWRGKQVLEVGAGVGTDARRLISAGARYTGINIDRGSAEATARALRLFALPGVSLQRDARLLDFSDGFFDVVYSFGVLQYIPEAARAVAELERVLAPGGELLVMLYNRSSINYALEMLSRNTNGPDYPHFRVYGAREAEELLSRFEIVRHEVRFLDHRHWGLLGRLLPSWLQRELGRLWGWHRILHVRKPVHARRTTDAQVRS
jgi:SAM-dependent methyltransferase